MTASTEPPVTGNAVIDQALAGVSFEGDVDAHAEQIERAHAVLQDVLSRPAEPSQR